MAGNKIYGFSEIDEMSNALFVFIGIFAFIVLLNVVMFLEKIISPFLDNFPSFEAFMVLSLFIFAFGASVLIAFYTEKIWLCNAKENKYQKLMEEKTTLEDEFKNILEKKPTTLEEYVDAFMSVYRDSYPEKINEFKRLLYLSQKIPDDKVEEAITSYFKSMLWSKENFRYFYCSEPIYNFKIIYDFTTKYGNDYNISDIENLNKLLLQKGIKFHNIGLLESLVSYSVFKQNYDNFKEKIEATNPRNETEYIEQFIRGYRDNTSTNMSYFYLLLSERNMTNLPFEEFKESMSTKIFEMILVSDANKKVTIDDVDKMNGYEFENFIGSIYEEMGYSVEQTPKSGDQGADLIITKFDERTAVQTKNYTGNVSNKAIQEVVASKKYYKCASCGVVTNSYFTKSAMELGNANGVKLVDREELKVLIDKYM